MADYCLPPALADKFLNALKTGAIVPEKLMGMTSAERRDFFKGMIGEDHAQEVNALFESKMLLKDQKRGLVTWAKAVAGISEPRRADLLSKISKLDRVLNPADESKFLADLAASKLGATVTVEETKRIFAVSQKAEAAKTVMLSDMRPETWTAYGRALNELDDTVQALSPSGRGFSYQLARIANVPRSLMSTLDLSAPFNQGWGLMTSGRFWEGFGRQFKYFASEDGFQDLRGFIRGHPDYEIARKAKLGLTELGSKLTAREESIQSDLVENAAQYLTDKTGVPNLIRASNRAYVGFLNYARFHTFTDALTAARLAGEDVNVAAADIARVVNNFSGRGDLGRFESAGPLMNTILFAPRKIVATLGMFNPASYIGISPTARRLALRNLTGSLVATGAVLGLARAMGAKIDLNPSSAHFLMFGVDGEWFDTTGGNAVYARLVGRMVSGHELTANGRLVELGQGIAPTRADLLVRFLRGKLNVIPGIIADALYGKDLAGRPFSVTQEMSDKLLPMTIGNYIDMAREDPNATVAWLPALSAIFGVGMMTPLGPLTRGKNDRDEWGEMADKAIPEQQDLVIQTMNRVGVPIAFPPKKIRGVALTDDQYDEYQQRWGRLSRAAVAAVIRTRGFDRMPLGVQESMIKDALSRPVTGAHEQATARMMMRYPTIARQADLNKRRAAILGTAGAIARRPIAP